MSQYERSWRWQERTRKGQSPRCSSGQLDDLIIVTLSIVVLFMITYDSLCYNAMINRNYAEDSRRCERVKFDQALYILTMYEKKIRKHPRNIPQGTIDADTEMQDIIASWKNKWKMDMTKPILNCVTSVAPRILIDLSQQQEDSLARYYHTLNRFLMRFRTEQEDETNFKMIIQQYDRQVEYLTSDKYIASSKAMLKGFLDMAKNISDKMIAKMMANYETVTNEMLDVNLDNLEWQALRPLRYIRQIARRALQGDQEADMENQGDIEPKCPSSQSLIAFCGNTVRLMERIKESEHGSTLITIQPKIDELTLLLHPLLMAIGANFKKEHHEKVKDFDWSKIKAESIPMMDNNRASYSCSKVVFINLDGYESEFNLQFVRNYKKHLMYISFPKEEAKLDEVHEIYSSRFFKKLMFRYSQSLYETYSDNYMSEDYKTLSRIERLNFNPEEYHTHIETIYDTKNEKTNDDFNQNIFVFPIRMSILFQKFKQILQNKEDIENHESYFLRFIIRDFLLNQIREFGPSLIMISYSGRIHIENHHFVEIIQELTKIANYKLMFYPNLTSAFVTNEMAQAQDQDGQMGQYDNHIQDPRITQLLEHNDLHEDPMHLNDHWIELFNKMTRFLKVSSGTYNLSRNYEEEPLVNRYKNQYILKYVDQLMIVLGKEYPTIQKIKYQKGDLSILPKLFEENIKSIKKTFEHTVPKLFFDIYDILEYLLFDRSTALIPKRQGLLKEYTLAPEKYQDLLDRLRDNILLKSNYEVTVINTESIGEELEREKNRRMKEVFSTLKESHLFEISSQKFEEKINIYFKTNKESKEYDSITEEGSSIQGLYETTFYLTGKVNLKIYESTKVLYKLDQTQRQGPKIPILIMNNLTQDDSPLSFENYYAEMDISNNIITGDKKAFQEKKCLAVPVTFDQEEGEEPNDRKLYVLADWNYHQTQNYIILFWPTKYDFVEAFLLNLMNKPYRPPILNSLYYYRKGSKNVHFKKVNTHSPHDISARIGTSCYSAHGKVYIFGGFYEGDKNYLELQHDIVVLDMLAFEQSGEAKLPMENIKHLLYGHQTLGLRIERKQKPNSFVRPRIEFEFFQKEEIFLDQDEIEEDNNHVVIMLGGYGQNFLRPYSLLTYYYYVLTFQTAERRLQSIERKFIYEKAIPVNTRQMTKNLGVMRTNKKNKNSVLEGGKINDSNAYTLYRNVFRIDRRNGEDQFNYKNKYMFCEEEYRSFKHEIKRIQELRADQFDNATINVERDMRNNHILNLEKDGKKKMVTLRLDIPAEKARKIEGTPREVSLTHESIVCLDVSTTTICAIVNHKRWTGGKSILVEYNTKCLEGLNFEQDAISHITLTWVRQFDCDLTLHILIILNKSTFVILHGLKLAKAEAVKEFVIKSKKTKSELACHEIKEKEGMQPEDYSLVNTVFFRIRNKISTIEFIAQENPYEVRIQYQEIEMQVSSDQYRWSSQKNPAQTYQFRLPNKKAVKMEDLIFKDFLRNNKEYYLVVGYNHTNLICEVNQLSRVMELFEEDKIKLDMENMDRGIVLGKTWDKYQDREYI